MSILSATNPWRKEGSRAWRVAPLRICGLTLCALAYGLASAQWPAAGGTAWISGGTLSAKEGKDRPVLRDGRLGTVLPRPSGSTRAAVEMIVVAKADGEVVQFGKSALLFTSGRLSLSNGRAIPLPTAKLGTALDIVFQNRTSDLAVYVNGVLFTTIATKQPTRVSVSAKSWEDRLLALATYPKGLSAGQIATNAATSVKLTNGPDTKTVTIDAELTLSSEIPDPKRIKPYRNALLAQEYKVIRVIEGRRRDLKPGAAIRVFRYGIWDGKKTDLQNMKAGDRVRVVVELLSSDSVLEREYQVDSLDTSYNAPYVEVPKGAG